jgi:hypothetical protein
MLFAMADLSVSEGVEVGFAFGDLQWVGRLPDRMTFRYTVRITFCLSRRRGNQTAMKVAMSLPRRHWAPPLKVAEGDRIEKDGWRKAIGV